MSRRRLLVVWSYLSEILLATLLTTLLCFLIDKSKLVEFIQQSAIDFATLFCAIFFAGALGFLWTFYSKADSKFYVWLDSIGASAVYLHATVYTVFVEGAATLALTFVKYFKNEGLALFGAFLFFLAFINSYTMIINVMHVMKLQITHSRLNGSH